MGLTIKKKNCKRLHSGEMKKKKVDKHNLCLVDGIVNYNIVNR